MKSTGSYSGKLSKETNFSLKHTTLALLKLTKYLLDQKVLQYVLLGKFQNDDIESRFGQYRQMSGGNYNITVTEILDLRKNLKLSMIKRRYSLQKQENFQEKTFSQQTNVKVTNKR